MPEYSILLKKIFPDDWQTILAMAYCRFVKQSSIKMMDFNFSGSWISELLPEANLSGDYLTKHIRKIGIKREGACVLQDKVEGTRLVRLS